jgi:heme exporter protein D
MAFDSLAELLYMNGHGGYVWFCYAATAVALFYTALAPGLRRRRLEQAAARRRARERSRRGASTGDPPGAPPVPSSGQRSESDSADHEASGRAGNPSRDHGAAPAPRRS